MPAFTPKTLAQMRQTIDNYIINNSTNSITPAEIRAILQTMLDFCLTYFGNQSIQTLSIIANATTFDVQEGSNGALTLTGASTTLSVDNLQDGQFCTLIVSQDATGGRLLVFDDPTLYMVANDGAGIVILSPDADAVDVVTIFKNSGKHLVVVGNKFTNA